MSEIFKKNLIKGNKKKGFAMVEIIVAASMISVLIIASMYVAQRSISLSRQALHQGQSGLLLEEGAEALRTIRDAGWSNISSLSVGTNYYPKFTNSTNTWSLSTTPADGTVGIFARKVVFSTVYRNGSYNIASSGTTDADARLATVTVSWSDSGKTISKTLPFYLLNIF